MKSYVWLTFGFMGWAYYEMSGGSEFELPEQIIAEVEVVEPEVAGDAPEIVARADTTTLLSVSTSNIAPQTVAAEVAEVEELVVEAAAPAIESLTDLRSVAGSRVNMRMGPSTDFEVITTLNSGIELEVLEVNAEGWANVLVVESGVRGWMAERLLTDPQT